MAQGDFFIISGASGSGKTTIVTRLVAERRSATRFITMTTRPPRPGEVDGVDYHFVTRTTFEGCIARGEMLEWAEVYGNLYGSSRTHLVELRATHDVVFSIVDVQGAKTLSGLIPDAVSVFLTAPFDQIERRLTERPASSPAELEKRLAAAARENELAETFDHVVSSADGEIESTLAKVRSIVQREHAAQL